MASNAKMAGLALTALKSNFTRLDRPYKLNFSVTYNCQSRCITCSIWDIHPKDELTIDEIRSFASKNNYFRWITLTGGEPFLRSDIVEIAKAFKDNCRNLYILTIPTNSLCSISMVERKIRDMLQLGIPRMVMTVSLDGHRELHDKIRGIPGNFDKAMDNYRMMMGIKKDYKNFDAVFGYTMSKFNKGEFEKTYQAVKQFFPDITYNNFHINVAQSSETYYKNASLDISPIGEDASIELAQILSKRQKRLDPMHMVENAFLKKLVQFARDGKSPMKCRSLDASLFLDGWGNVYPSIMWSKKVGNIRDVNYELAKLWHTPEAEEIRHEIRAGMEPSEWTSCEAYQSITGSIGSLL